jgi:hypothetical protein
MKAEMKHPLALLVGFALVLLGAGTAQAWQASGSVFCDANHNGQIDASDLPLVGVEVDVKSATFSGTVTTDASGNFVLGLPDTPDSYIETLNKATLPADATYVIPTLGSYTFVTSDASDSNNSLWLINSATCQQVTQSLCWFTGGGSVGASDGRNSFGGNVHPGCSATAGQGGQWNNVAHDLGLHFQGTVIPTVRCGNVSGIPPGSTSPKTPYNFIEFEGTGTLKGIAGNKADNGTVYFFARGEDRGEPGSAAATDPDRYFLHVYSDPADSVGSTLLLVDIDGDPATVDPVPIDGGNLQIHISSCSNPPK